jgi:hypothetical protein
MLEKKLLLALVSVFALLAIPVRAAEGPWCISKSVRRVTARKCWPTSNSCSPQSERLYRLRSSSRMTDVSHLFDEEEECKHREKASGQ